MTPSGLLLSVAFLIAVLILGMSGTTMHGVKRYDCSIAEISPDYPVEVKDACRRIRAEKTKE